MTAIGCRECGGPLEPSTCPRGGRPRQYCLTCRPSKTAERRAGGPKATPASSAARRSNAANGRPDVPGSTAMAAAAAGSEHAGLASATMSGSPTLAAIEPPRPPLRRHTATVNALDAVPRSTTAASGGTAPDLLRRLLWPPNSRSPTSAPSARRPAVLRDLR